MTGICLLDSRMRASVDPVQRDGLVAPGHPERSVLLHRIATRDAGYMPPLATAVVDREAVKLLPDWIQQMKHD